jgi:nicotinic acid phosphoribosyltransferase
METQTVTKQKIKGVRLPKKRDVEVPRLLLADAYTIGSDLFESEKAKEKSVYYVTFRRLLSDIDKDIYKEGDNRMVFIGLQDIIEKILYKPVTHEEIDNALEFLKDFRVGVNGLEEYGCPEHLWRRIVDEFAGYPPIKISAMPEGSVIYPNEPVIRIESLVDGFGQLAAWFESKI